MNERSKIVIKKELAISEYREKISDEEIKQELIKCSEEMFRAKKEIQGSFISNFIIQLEIETAEGKFYRELTGQE